MKKQQIPIAEGLPMIQEMVKSVVISAKIGKTSSWIHNKQNHNVIYGKQQLFTEDDIRLLNSALPEIGKQILSSVIVYTDNRDEMSQQMRTLFAILRSYYVFCEKMGKTKSWYQNRISKKQEGTKRASFSSSDVLAVNTIALEIANTLLPIEFTL